MVKRFSTKKEREFLYKLAKISLGYPSVSVEIDDDTMDILFESAMQDYSSYMNDWLVSQQWTMLQGASAENGDMLFALMAKGLSWEREFTNAYSKQVMLANDATFPSKWSLEVDYVETIPDQQTYIIPAGREIMKVMWASPPSINKAGFFNALGSYATSFGSVNFGSGMGLGGGYQTRAILPMYSILLAAQDLNMRERIFQSEATYRVTQNEDGTKTLWLYPIPNSRHEIAGRTKGMENRKIWYFYYNIDKKDRNKCLELYDDTIKTPNDVRIETIKWEKLNDSSRSKLKKLFIAYVKKHIGTARGKFTGELNFNDAQRTLDYRILLDQADKEEQEVKEELKTYLEKFEYDTLMEKRANIAENLNRVLKYIPMKKPIRVY